jgi:HAD superfamily hydrolase (TIGR01509 family)
MREVEAVLFDLDGVLVDSEAIWDGARRTVVARHGGRWHDTATRDMMGMSSPEWSAYLRDQLHVPLSTDRISAEVVELVGGAYDDHLPLLPGARDAVVDLSRRWPLGLASSSNRVVIERFLDASGLRAAFAATVSSEEVPRGKPAPDVYLAAAGALAVAPEGCVAVEDSTNGVLAASAAGTCVIAVPNREFPPSPEALATAALVLPDLTRLDVETIAALAR